MASSERYGDPRVELLRGQAWEAARESVARALKRSVAAPAGPGGAWPPDAVVFTAQLTRSRRVP